MKTEFLNKKVKVDFREETGIIKAHNKNEVNIFYPDLEFSEVVNLNLVEVKFIEN